MKMGFYAYDVGPSNVLKMVAEAAAKMGHETIVLPPQVRGITAERGKEMVDCDIIALGLSSFQTQEETALIEQLSGNIPIIIIEDVPGSSLRPKAKGYTDRIPTVLIALPMAEEAARNFGYRNIVHVGPPPHWGKSFAEMKQACEENIRAHLAKRYPDGVAQTIGQDDTIIYCPGTKQPVIVNRFLGLAIEAGKKLLGEKFIVAFRKHPGEKAEKEEDKPLFERLFAERERFFKDVWVLDVTNLNSPQSVAVADLTIFTGGPTESIVAAYLRKSILYYADEDTEAFLKTSGSADGKWFVAEYGGAYKINGPQEVEAAIRHMLTAEGKEALRRQQEKNFPLPDTWDTAPEIVKRLAAWC